MVARGRPRKRISEARKRLGKATASAGETLREVAEEVGERKDALLRRVEEQPGRSLLVAGLVGFLAGLCVRRCR